MKTPWHLPALVALVGGLAVLSLMAGKVWAPFDTWLVHDDPRSLIIFQLRLPRTLLAMAVGAALAMSGAALQGYTRNPLADPGILGVSAMAALGAVVTLYFGASNAAAWLLPAAAILGAVIGVLLLVSLAGLTASVITFVLAGAVLQIVAASAVSLALSLSPNPWATQEIIDWLMGSFTDRCMDDVAIALPLIALGAVLLLSARRALDALSLGEASAVSLGVDLPRTQLVLALGVGLATGASVATTGVISFVGLIVPHLLRPLVGAQPGRLLIPSAVGGAALVLAADILVRLTPTAAEVKLGIALSALGGPFFLAMLIDLRRRVT